MMSPPATMYRLLIVEPCSLHALLVPVANDPDLPVVEVPHGCRLAYFFTGHLRQAYGLATVLVATFPSDIENPLPVAVLEIVAGQSASLLDPFLFTGNFGSHLSGQQESALERVFDGTAVELGRFARFGWIGELVERIGAVIKEKADPRDIRHINSGINFSLLELRLSSGRRLWFKAVGPPNEDEYAMTLHLAERYPAFVPRSVLTIPEWNGWVAEHVEGDSLDDRFSLDRCAQALAALATLQRAASADCQTLLSMGAKDWRAERLLGVCELFFGQAMRMMHSQQTSRVQPMSAAELDHLQLQICMTLTSAKSSASDALLHGDLGHGNVRMSPRGPIFLDWAEAAVGHPCISMEHLLAGIKRSHTINRQQESELRQHYFSRWEGSLGATDTAVFPGLAAFVYAISLWEASSELVDPKRMWPMIRSVLRTARRELN